MPGRTRLQHRWRCSAVATMPRQARGEAADAMDGVGDVRLGFSSRSMRALSILYSISHAALSGALIGLLHLPLLEALQAAMENAGLLPLSRGQLFQDVYFGRGIANAQRNEAAKEMPPPRESMRPEPSSCAIGQAVARNQASAASAVGAGDSRARGLMFSVRSS
jgi:hypothetical protein